MILTTLKGLLAHRRRLLTTAAAVMLGVAFMAGTLVFTDTIGERFDALVADANSGVDTLVRAEATFVAESTLNGNGQGVRDLLDDGLVAQIASVDGVDVAVGRTTGFAQIVGADGDVVGGGMTGLVGVGGNWIDDDRLNPFRLADGAAPTEGDQVVIDSQTAEQGALAVGDRTTVMVRGGPTPVEVVGIATFGDAPGMYDTSSILFTDDAAQRLVGAPGRVGEVVAVGSPDVSAEELTARIGAVLPAGTEALAGDAVIAEAQSALAADLGFFNTFMLTFAIVALVVGAFIITNTFSIIVAQRTEELAVLRAVGASRRQVLSTVLVEAMVIGVLASIAGMVAGVGVAAGLRSLMSGLGLELPASGLVLRPSSMLIAFVVGVVVTVASAVLPARRAARIAPMAALRGVAVDSSAGSRVRVVAGSGATAFGAALLGLGLAGVGDQPLAFVGAGALIVFAGVAVLGAVLARPVSRFVGAPLARLGLSGALARENAMRSPKRTAATAAALMIGVALVAFISILAGSIKASIDESVTGTIRGEFIVESGTFLAGGLDPSLSDQLGGLDEVAHSTGLAFVDAAIDDRSSIVGAVDATALTEVFTLDITDGSITSLDVDSIAVNTELAEAQGWHVGDRVKLVLADGAARTVVVAAHFSNRDLVDVFVDRGLVASLSPAPLDSAVFVRLADGVDLEAGRAGIASVTDEVANAELLDRNEYVAMQAAMVDPLLGLIYALLALAVVIAVLGIANTLSLSTMERVRELGLLRAVGMTRRQTRSMVRSESVIIALFGTVLGLAIGVGFGWAVVDALASEGITALAVPIGTLVAIAVLAAFAGVLASIGPARRASRVDLLEALRAS